MNIQKLKFSHFRNYESASFSFEPACVHVLYGRNAQGKTNILESIYYLSHLRSFRTQKTASLIQHGSEYFAIDCVLEKKGRKEDLRVYASENKKRLFRYGSPITTASSFVGIVNAILFCPDDLNLFSASPQKRRQFMDMELVKISRAYTSKLSHYQKLLKERNLALKAGKPDPVLIDTYTEQMIEDQTILIKQRAMFLKNLEQISNEELPGIAAAEETMKIRYRTCVDPEQDIRKQLEEAYRKSRNRDLQFKNTSVGIHKDDIEFYLNERLMTQTASQGQKRSMLLAMKIALARIIYEKTSEYPILLLDDVLSELDPSRRAGLIARLPEQMQIFISTSEELSPSLFSRPVRFYTVESGKMKEGIYHVES